MAELVLQTAKDVANYVRRKGYAEIYIRDSKGRCVTIAKTLLKSAKDNQKDKITEIIVKTMKEIGLSDNALNDFKNDLLKQINPQFVRKQLAGIARGQAANNVMLKDLAKNVSSIYSSVNSVQMIGWLNAALSAANLAATVASTVIICEKLDQIDKKLNRIEGKIDQVKHVQFVSDIKTPCRAVIKDYKVITADLAKGREVTESRLLQSINQCCGEIEKLYDVRNDYPIGDILGLLYDLLPIFTDLICLYYQYYYDFEHGEYSLHQDWLKVYDMLDSTAFRNQVQDYLIIDEKLGNVQQNEIMDCLHLVTVGSKHKIEEVLSDLETCESTEDYRDIMEFSRQYALQQAKTIEADLQSQFGIAEAEIVMAEAKKQHMFGK